MIGILAGKGELPHLLIKACQEQQKPYFILAFHDQTNPALVENYSHAWVKLGKIQQALNILHQLNVTHLVMAGSFKRPALSQIGMDKTAIKWFIKIGSKAFGDDGLLSGITQLLREEGFKILAPQDLLTNLLAPIGPIGQIRPDQSDLIQLEKGIQILKDLSSHDIGQGLIIEENVILAIEAIEGTDAMLERTKHLKREKCAGILIKMFKLNQSMQVDLPTIGPKTVELAASIGLRGIAVQAGKSNIINLPEVIRLADHHKIFVYGYHA